MFNFDYFVGYSTCKNMVHNLYPNLDLSCLNPFGRNFNEFFIETHKAILYQFLELIIPCRMSHGVPTHEIESMESLEAKED